MQTKSEMINRIAELAEEVEQRKHEYEVLDACLELAQGKIAELKAENEKYKQENKELAHYLACMTEQRNKANTCLQEIKEIAEFHITQADSEDVQNDMKQILDLITKAESEG